MRTQWIFVCAIASCLASSAFGQTDPPDPWLDLMNKATALDKAGDYPRAILIYRQAAAMVEGPGSRRLAISLNALANAEDQLGRNADSEALFKRAVAIAGRNGIYDALYGLTLSNFGVHYLEFGEPDKARGLLSEAVGILTRVMPPDSVQLALTRNALGNLLMNDGDFDQAEKLIEASITTYRKNADPKSDELAVGLNNLGVVRRHQGRSDEALQLFQQSIELVETTLGPDHPSLLRALANLGTVYGESGRREEADAAFQRALSIGEKRLGTTHPIYALVLLNYSRFLRASGQKRKAKTLEARANALLHEHSVTNGTGMTIDVSSFRH
ncbi:MAG TPA: tetratricopeptide repeat protein [Bryobacteraceae bacterium]|nr:tetratricopeptide repeat protein [Bryobacteraceae bacterium]